MFSDRAAPNCGQTRIKVGVGHTHCTTVGPSDGFRLSPVALHAMLNCLFLLPTMYVPSIHVSRQTIKQAVWDTFSSTVE